jgi:CRP-like cAMP-binding protein
MNHTTIYLKAGEYLFREGDPCNGVYILRSGSIEILRERESVAVNLAVMSAGDVIGTSTIFSRAARTASARAVLGSEIIHVSLDTLEGHFKNLPVWVEAVIKDSVSRLRVANDKLVESKLNERKLQHKLGTQFHVAAQFAFFLAYAIRVGLVRDEGIDLFPLKGFIEYSESILLRRSEVFESFLECFVTGSLIKIQMDKKWGRSLFSPQPAVLEDFARFLLQSHASGFQGFVHRKHQNLLSALVRLSRRPDAKEFYTRKELCERVEKEAAVRIGPELIDELTVLKVLQVKNASDAFFWNDKQLQRRIIFESTCRALRDAEKKSQSEQVA